MAISASELIGRVRSELQGVPVGVEACDQNGARAWGFVPIDGVEGPPRVGALERRKSGACRAGCERRAVRDDERARRGQR